MTCQHSERTESDNEMRRKEKRLLQFAGLLIAALLFLPNVGLWSLYRDRMFENSPELVEGPGGISQMQVGITAFLVVMCMFGVERGKMCL